MYSFQPRVGDLTSSLTFRRPWLWLWTLASSVSPPKMLHFSCCSRRGRAENRLARLRLETDRRTETWAADAAGGHASLSSQVTPEMAELWKMRLMRSGHSLVLWNEMSNYLWFCNVTTTHSPCRDKQLQASDVGCRAERSVRVMARRGLQVLKVTLGIINAHEELIPACLSSTVYVFLT